MTLRVKIVGAFCFVTITTLIASGIGYWQTRKLASALYEVGAVRLPTIQALDRIFEAKTALDASKRELLREALLFENPAVEVAAMWPAWTGVIEEEHRRQGHAWSRIEKNWKTYATLPQTPEEAALWREFVRAWAAWKSSYEKVMAALLRAKETGDRTMLVAAREENDTNLYEPAREARLLLADLVRENEAIATASAARSVASQRDVRLVGWIMLGVAVASATAAVGSGIFLSRKIGLPLGRMAEAFSRIARGDLTTQVPVNSRDEIGQMAAAMNHMVDSLRTSELRFRAVFEHSIDAIGVSKDGRMVLANPALLSLFGYAASDGIIGREVLEFLAPDCHPTVLDRIQRRARGEILPPMYELTGLRKDGTSFAMEVQSTAFQMQGETYAVAIQRDISERKRSALLLAESAERLELALRTAKLGIWRRHLVSGAGEWDVRMFELLGLPHAPQPPTRDQVLALVVPEDRAEARLIWNPPPEAGRSFRHRFRINRPDGQVRHLEAQGVLLGSPGRPPEWSVGVTGDITEIVVATAESARLREQLLQAQKMETLGTLSAGIAHDFNNLLTGINGYVELAATCLPPGHEAADLLKQARQGTLSARELVRRILTFSRQAHTSNRTPLNLGDIIRDTAALISAVLPSPVTLALDLAPSLPLVLADSGQIQQVLMNLCTNGAHAIGAQPGTLRIGLHPRTGRTGAGVALTVSDSGAGMDAATVQRVFEPFFTTKKPGEGTGLGLAIVHDIITTHEGEITVASTPGRGTTFTCWFPVHAGAALPTARPPARHPARGTGQRILVVDDEPSVTRIVQLALQRAGYTPEVFTSSPEAWSHFARQAGDYQLLLIDQQMPGLSGLDFIARARQLAPSLPVIRMGGRFERDDFGTSDAATGIGLRQLKKPFEIAELLELVATVLNTWGGPTAGTAHPGAGPPPGLAS
jgi:PAS domain S-box-containing protein